MQLSIRISGHLTWPAFNIAQANNVRLKFFYGWSDKFIMNETKGDLRSSLEQMENLKTKNNLAYVLKNKLSGRWLNVYFIIAILNSVFLIIFASFSKESLDVHSQALQYGEYKYKILNQTSKILKSLMAVNSPGNSVFNSKDVRLERERLKKSLNDFQDFKGEFVILLGSEENQFLRLHGYTEENKNFLQNKYTKELSQITDSVSKMTDLSEKIFVHFKEKKVTEASVYMAKMDDVYYRASLIIELIRHTEREDTMLMLSSLENVAKHKQYKGSIISFLIFLTALGFLLYGYSISKVRKELISQTSRNTQIFNAINNVAIVAFTDSSGKIIEVNDNFCKVSGYPREELIGQNHRILSSGVHSKEFFKNLWKVICSGNTWSGDIQNKNKNGEFYFVRSVITPIVDLNGKIEQFLAVRFDITDQKKTESMLCEAQELAKIGSWKFDLQSNDLIWSSEHYRIFEIEEQQKEQDLYKLYRQRIHPEDLADLDRSLHLAANQGQDFVYNCRVWLDGGNRIKYVRGIGKVNKDKNGVPVSISGTSQDLTNNITMQKNLEFERAKSTHSAKLASLGEMSAGIAHEINSPLAIITGSLAVLLKFKDDVNKIESKIEAIKGAAGRIEKIVRGLKKFSRTTGNLVERKLESVETIISEAIVLVEAKAIRFGVTIEVHIEKNLFLFCDQVEIEQVVVNLVSNAVDAVKKLESRWVKIKSFSDEKHVFIQVIDSGSGISEALGEKLFQPFYTTKPAGEGTGLGLAIAKGIVDDHSGTLYVNRDISNTCFEIKFLKTSERTRGASDVA